MHGKNILWRRESQNLSPPKQLYPLKMEDRMFLNRKEMIKDEILVKSSQGREEHGKQKYDCTIWLSSLLTLLQKF